MVNRTGFGILVAFGVVAIPMPVLAQSLITPDDTLGSERSQIDTVGDTELITGGARRSQNLFHSFSEFNVDEGRGAFFFSPDGLERIFSRVTGGNTSSILGILGTFGDSTPDLYLINPNGILFGPNSSLNVGGSFAATTADAIQFGEDVFSAVAPEAPSALLTIAPSAFLFRNGPAGNIVNQSAVPSGLRVADGADLLLLGGDVMVDGGQLTALGGRIDVGAVRGVGVVGLNDGRLSVPEGLARGNVEFSNGAFVDVAFDGGGSIVITAQDIDIRGGSFFQAGTVPGLGTVPTIAEDIILDASGAVRVRQSSAIGNLIFPNAVGAGGNIRITAAVLEVLDGSQLIAITLGQGNAGDITINTSERTTVAGKSEDGQFVSSVFSTVEAIGIGAGGNIDITTAVLEVLDGAQLGASIRGQGQGDAGDVVITASDRVTFAGTSEDGQFSSSAFSTVGAAGVGAGGSIDITTAILEVLDGAALATGTRGLGDAGDIIITASDRATFIGESEDGQFSSGAFSTVNDTGIGSGGSIDITTAVLEVLDGAVLATSTSGEGDAGDVVIIASDRATFAGATADGQFVSGITSAVNATGVGAGGNIDITTAVLEVLGGAQLTASTFGRGDAGNIVITVSDRATFAGTSGGTQFSSGAASAVEETGTGSGGDIDIITAILEILDGAQLVVGTRGQGNAGSVIVDASDRTILDGVAESGFSSSILTLTTASSSGSGGLVRVDTPIFVLSNGAIIDARTENAAPGGTITIAADALTLENGALISAQSDGSGTAGDIRLNAIDTLQITDSDITTAALQSSGGDILINTTTQNALTLLQGDSDITTNSLGNGGNITIGGLGLIAFNDSDIISSSGSANGGNITLNTFLSEPTPPGNAIEFDGNDQVDVNASGALSSGIITAPDTSVIQNSLAALPEGILSTESLIANSCVVRNEDGSGSFVVTGASGLPERPGNTTADYATGAVEPIPGDGNWQPGDPIVEPQGLYELPSGALVLSHGCQ